MVKTIMKDLEYDLGQPSKAVTSCSVYSDIFSLFYGMSSLHCFTSVIVWIWYRSLTRVLWVVVLIQKLEAFLWTPFTFAGNVMAKFILIDGQLKELNSQCLLMWPQVTMSTKEITT